MKGRVVAAVILAWIVFGAILGLVLTAGDSGQTGAATDGDMVAVHVGEALVTSEIASTDRSRTRGLAGRSELSEDEGMLFVFDSLGRRDFWMRGVDFPLDMIWIRDGRVRGVTPDVPPEAISRNRLYPSPGPIDRVLEMRGGWAAARSIRTGDPYRGP